MPVYGLGLSRFRVVIQQFGVAVAVAAVRHGRLRVRKRFLLCISLKPMCVYADDVFFLSLV